MKPSTIWRAIGAAVLCILLVACGGGSGTSVPAAGAGLSLIAGSTGGTGAIDGSGTAARLGNASSMAADSAGNLYIAETDNRVIRRVTPAGVVSTFAGSVPAPFSVTDGAGSAARFWEPHSLTSDGSNLYLLDRDPPNSRMLLRKIDATGSVTTLANFPDTGGSGSTRAVTMIVADRSGRLFLADRTSIRMRLADGTITEFAGAAGVSEMTDGDGVAARFKNIQAFGIDGNGNLLVGDSPWNGFPPAFGSGFNGYDNTVRRVAPSGSVQTVASFTVTPILANAQAAQVSRITGDAQGNIYVLESESNASMSNRLLWENAKSVWRIAADGSTSRIDATLRQGRDSGVTSGGLVVVDGNLFYADSLGLVQKITSGNDVSNVAGAARVYASVDGTGAAAGFSWPVSITSDGNGTIHVIDERRIFGFMLDFLTIRRINPAAQVSSTIADGTGYTSESRPVIAADRSGNLYIAEGGSVIFRLAPGGTLTLVAGERNDMRVVDGPAASARFAFIQAMAADRFGNLYVLDGQTIRKITSDGIVSSVAGGQSTFADGIGGAAGIYFAQAMTCDPGGNVYFIDRNTVRRMTPQGEVTTIAGIFAPFYPDVDYGSTDGTGSAARFNDPRGIAADEQGNVYVADTANHTIRKVTPAGVVTTIAGVAGRSGIAAGNLPGNLTSPLSIAAIGGNSLAVISEGAVLNLTLP